MTATLTARLPFLDRRPFHSSMLAFRHSFQPARIWAPTGIADRETRQYAIYRQFLIGWDRWPAKAE
jgi:hypothetical protein